MASSRSRALAASSRSRLALALGAADGLRQRAGLRPWPLRRRSEAELAARVSSTLGPEVFANVFAAGSQLDRREAITLVRSLAQADGSGEGRPEGGTEVAG